MKFSAWWLMLASPLIIWLGYGMGKLFGGPYRASSSAKRDIAGDGSYSSWSHADSACDSDGGTNGGDCGDGGDGGGD